MRKLSTLLVSFFCAISCPGATGPVVPSLTVYTAEGNNHSVYPLVSRDGSTLAFESLANNLLATPITNKSVKIFAQLPGHPDLELVSIQPSGAMESNDVQISDLSKDGSVALYETEEIGINSFGVRTRVKNLYARSLSSGTTFLINGDFNGNKQIGISKNGILSGDGNFILFESSLNNLSGNPLPASTNYLYIRDILAGKTTAAGTNFWDGNPSTIKFTSGALSLNGSYGAFGLNTNGADFVVVQDFIQNTNRLVWVNTLTNQVFISNLRLSDDGRFLGFGVSNPSNTTSTVYLMDLESNILTTVGGCDYIGQKGEAFGPQFTANGRFISYMAPATGTNDSFTIWDRQSGAAILTAPGLLAKVSLDGSIVTFLGQGKDYGFGVGMTNHQVIQINRTLATTNLISSSANGSVSPAADASSVSVSEDGRRVVFQGHDGNLIVNDSNGFLEPV